MGRSGRSAGCLRNLSSETWHEWRYDAGTARPDEPRSDLQVPRRGSLGTPAKLVREHENAATLARHGGTLSQPRWEKTGEPVQVSLRNRHEGRFFEGDEVKAAYFDAAEQGMDRHWTEIIGPFIGDIQYETALDLASGHGRNALRLGQKASRVYCLDINPEKVIT